MNDVFNLKNEKNQVLSFMPYKENFRVALAPQEMISIDTLTDEEWLYYNIISKDFLNPSNDLYYFSFLNGNNGAFLENKYGTMVTNNDGTISVLADSNGHGPQTFFGTSDNNIPYKSTGVTTKVNLVIDSTSMKNDEYFNITVAVNSNKDGQISFIGERSLYFRKYSAGIKVGYEENGSNDAINKSATSNSSSVVLVDGNYIVEFYVHKKSTDNTIVMDIKLINESGSVVFSALNCSLKDDSGIANEDNIAGIRYLWFSSMNVTNGVKLNSLSVN